MILTAFNTEFTRIAKLHSATLTVKEMTELSDYVGDHDFTNPLINQYPLEGYKSEIGEGGNIFYSGRFELKFLTRVTKGSSQVERDAIIDTMVSLQERFFSTLHANEALVFQNPLWDWDNEILRQFTSEFLVGVKSRVEFRTECNRL